MNTGFKRFARHNSAIAGAICVMLLTMSLRQANAQSAAKFVDVNTQEANGINIQSPNAYAFAEYVVNPVGYYTGVPQISVPLYTIKLKDLSLPISLSYHAGGVKVEETASNVGLGWNLMAGGMITRAVKDKADDSSIGAGCTESWNHIPGATEPGIQGFTYCANGLLYAFNTPINTNFDGITTYDLDLGSFNGLPNTAGYSMKLLKKFYGVAPYRDNKDIWLLSMVDKEPDIYYFNFAGRTGQFVFDVSTTPASIRMFPHQDLDISYTTDPGTKKLIGFQIKDEQGITYTFSAIETTTNVTTVNNAPLDDITVGLDHHVKNFDTGNGSKKYNSSWFLTKIDTPLGEYLDLSYVDEEYKIAHRGAQQTGLAYIKPASGAMTYDPNDLTYETSNPFKGYYNSLTTNDAVIETKRLSTIENEHIKIEFKFEMPREDLVPVKRTINTTGGTQVIIPNPAFALTEVIVHNKIGGLARVKKFKLAYDFFLSNTAETINPVVSGPMPDIFDMNVEEPERYYKRLRLLSVQEFGKEDNAAIPPYSFEYKYSDFTGNAAHVLPHRLTFQQDLWGYYNGASGNKTLIPALYVYPTHYPAKDSRQFSVYRKGTYTGTEYFMPGANRLPDVSLADIGILTKITYPTKGHTSYAFQSHTFRDDGEEYSGGGLRIASIIKHNGENPGQEIVYNYTYLNADNTSSGAIVSKPVFAVRNTNLASMVANDDSELAYKSSTTRYSVPQAPLGSTNGSFVGYRRVTEAMPGNGRTVYTYSMPASWHVKNDIPLNLPAGECDPLIDGHCDQFYHVTPVNDIFISNFAGNLNPSSYDLSQNPALPNTFPFPDNPNYDWQRGHLLAEKYFSENNTLLKEVLYQYTNHFRAGGTAPINVYGYRISPHYPRLNNTNFPDAFAFRAAKYRILTGVAKVLDLKQEITYNTLDPTKSISSQVNYDYGNTNHLQATQISTTDSRGRTITHVHQYAEDLSGTELGSDLLTTNHIHGRLLRQVISTGGNPTSKIETKYESRSGKVVPAHITSFLRATNEIGKQVFDYDAHGNVVMGHQVFKEDASGAALVEGAAKAYVWGYKNTLPVAAVDNARSTDIFFTSFEDEEGNSDPGDCRTGHHSRINGYSKALTGLSNGSYILSYRLKSGNDWNLHRTTVSVASGSYTINFGAQEQVDDVRFYPAGASMVSYTYDPLTGMTSATDANEVTTFYTYDDLGRLAFTKDDKGNVIKTYTYHYKEQ